MSKPADDLERRHFHRVEAPITVRPVSILAKAIPRRVNDVSLGGLRAYPDERYRVGMRYVDMSREDMALLQTSIASKPPE